MQYQIFNKFFMQQILKASLLLFYFIVGTLRRYLHLLLKPNHCFKAKAGCVMGSQDPNMTQSDTELNSSHCCSSAHCVLVRCVGHGTAVSNHMAGEA